jgi:hypothetical protein
MANVALESIDLKSVVQNGERTERMRARATAETVIAQSAEAPHVNRVVDALGVFGIGHEHARQAIRDLIGDGRIEVAAGLVRAS